MTLLLMFPRFLHLLRRFEPWVWWVLTPLIVAFLVFSPYWLLNLGVSERLFSWWRVPILPAGVFDTHVYLHWLAAAVQGVEYGNHMRWLAPVFSWIWNIGPASFTFPELWLVTRWLTAVLSLWIGAWTIRLWSGCSVQYARLFSVGLWVGLLLVLSLRPGVYSWYMPFCLLGLGCLVKTQMALSQQRWLQGIGFSLIALVGSYLYPWFFLLVAAFLAVTWWRIVWMYKRWVVLVVLASVVLLVMFAAVPLARLWLDPSYAWFTDMYGRNGITFTRLPFFANTVLAFGLWIVTLFLLAREHHDEYTDHLSTAWMVLTILWFHPVFTGIFLYPDHFIISTAILSWLSLVALGIRRQPIRNLMTQRWLWLVTVLAWLVVGYIIQQPLRLHPAKFDPYLIHVFHWSALAFLATYLSLQRQGWRVWVVRGFAVFLIAIAAWGSGAVLIRNWNAIEVDQPRLGITEWLKTYRSMDTQGCASPSVAGWFAAHAGRRVFPAEALFSYLVPSEKLLRDLEVYASLYAVTTTHQEVVLKFATDNYRSLRCESGTKYSHGGVYGRALRWAGVDSRRIPDLLGCREELIDRNWRRVSRQFEAPDVFPLEAVTTTCAWVLTPTDERQYWRLPSSYHLVIRQGDWEVWQGPNTK